jgi:mono/diheme cytochrome c family protein
MKASHIVLGIVATAFISSCKNDPQSPGLEYMPDMYRSIGYETYDKSPIFSDGLSARQPVKGSVARYNPETLPYYETYKFPNTNEGYEEAGKSLTNPLPNNEEILALGQKTYGIFCVHCHGEKGDGNGILVQRDKFAGVPSYYSAALKDLPEGKMYHTIYYGKNMMGSHAAQINFVERWAVIRYVQKLRDAGLGIETAKTDTVTTSPVASK